jgi:hypothetical protein
VELRLVLEWAAPGELSAGRSHGATWAARPAQAREVREWAQGWWRACPARWRRASRRRAAVADVARAKNARDSGDAGNEAARGGNQAMAGDQARVGGVKVESFCAGCGNAVIVSRTQPRCSAKCQPREK